MGTGGIVMRAFIIFLALAAAIGIAAPSAPAQQAGSPDDIMGFENQPGQGGPSPGKREEIRKKIETVRIWRLTEQLKLDAATGAKLAALLSSFDQQRQKMVQEQMATMRELRAFLKVQKPDEGKLKTALDALQKNQHALQGLRDSEISGLRDILTIEQQARFVLFQQEFRREMQSMISHARGAGRGKGPMAGPGRGNGPGAQAGPEQ
jgi:cytochrome c556